MGASTPLVVTDRSWRFSIGELVGYSQPNYYQSSTGWGPVRDISGPHASVTTWSGAGGDAAARWVSTTHNLSGTSYPGGYTYFRSGVQASLAMAMQTVVLASGALSPAMAPSVLFSASGTRK